MFKTAKPPRRVVKRTLGIQTMESRQLMAADSFVTYAPTPPPAVVSFNDTMSTATNLGTVSHAVVRNDSVGGTDTADFYRFRVGTSGPTNIQLGGVSRDIDLYVTDSVGNRLASGIKGGIAAENVTVNLTAGRDYFLRVVPFGTGAVSNYQMQIHAPGTDNTMQTAHNLGPISSSLVHNSHVGGTDPADHFRFSFTSAGRQRIQLSGLSRDVDIYVLDSAGNTIASGRNGSTTSEDFYINVAANREYFLRVIPFGSSTAVSNYQLRLSVR